MKLEGSYDVKAPRQKVWGAFLDPETLRKAIPGCEKLELIGNDEYKATLKIGLAAEGSGGPGFVRADTLITLTDADDGTRVSYSADVQIGGLIAGVGQRMLGGVSKMMADQFFNKMTELLTTA